jgi:hypothetical protein
MLIASMCEWFHLFLGRWRNPIHAMSWNRDYSVFICIMYVVVLFNDIVRSWPHNSLPIGTLEEIIVVCDWWFGGESERVPPHPINYVSTRD